MTSFVAAQLPLRPFPHGTEQPGELGDHIMGMNVLGWLTEHPVAVWGERWMRAGRLNVTFSRPMVAGQTLSVDVESHASYLNIRYDDTDGRVCATSVATIDATDRTHSFRDENPTLERLTPDASSLDGALLSRMTFRFDADRDLAFLDDRPDANDWQGRRWAHPAWLGTATNAVIMRHIDFGDRERHPGRWLQVSTGVDVMRPIEDGAEIDTFSRIRRVSRLGRDGRHQVAHLECTFWAGAQPAARVTNAFIFADASRVVPQP